MGEAKPMLDLTEPQIAWIAGLLEGEGYFGIDQRSSKRYANSKSPASPFIKIAMVDEDVIARLSTYLDKPCYLPTRLTGKGKQVYQLHIGEKQKVLWLLQRIRPYMGERRGAKVDECLSLLHEWEEWVEKGGRSEQASYANKMKQLKQPKP
jgi:hypothetical protein